MRKIIIYQSDDNFYYILSSQQKTTRNSNYDLYRYSLIKTDSLDFNRMNSKHIIEKIFVGEFAINEHYIKSQYVVCLGLLSNIIYNNDNKYFTVNYKIDSSDKTTVLKSGGVNIDNIDVLSSSPEIASILTSYKDYKFIDTYQDIRQFLIKVKVCIYKNTTYNKEDYKKIYSKFYRIKKIINKHNLNFNISNIDIKKLKG
ncbi:hypothetical protein CSR02_14040 [Acetobacter pomorum]|uniref:Uncharacterized protein n=1 Tax=Acetobacter pomorum TaxID=65959 RepID=A0A2G4R8P0_9PROT|nr:hypothetical protein [Acetobacter pomorum]PHY92924.1 hypothetical protein CSR02_14040 [Acetobacter pomorum]